jgi:hypothetical protein
MTVILRGIEPTDNISTCTQIPIDPIVRVWRRRNASIYDIFPEILDEK